MKNISTRELKSIESKKSGVSRFALFFMSLLLATNTKTELDSEAGESADDKEMPEKANREDAEVEGRT